MVDYVAIYLACSQEHSLPSLSVYSSLPLICRIPSSPPSITRSGMQGENQGRMAVGGI